MEKEKSLISIIMPVYNAGQYLDSSITSILNQSYQNWELIAIDDASTDNSLEILQCFATNDQRINVIAIKDNSGVANARNIGINNAKGKYICWLDSDDIYDPSFLDIMLSIAEENQCDIVECTYRNFNNTPCNISNYNYDVKIGDGIDFIRKFSCYEAQTSLWSKIFKSSLFIGFQFPVGRIYEEPYFYFEKYSEFHKIAYITLPLYNYRSTPNSIMKTVSSASIESNIAIHNYLLNKVEGDIPYNDLLLKKVINGAVGFWKRVLYSRSSFKGLNDMCSLFDRILDILSKKDIVINYKSMIIIKNNNTHLCRFLFLLQFRIKQWLN